MWSNLFVNHLAALAYSFTVWSPIGNRGETNATANWWPLFYENTNSACFDDSFQRSLSWASSCNNTTASRLLLSCHTAAIATACQSQARVQNDTLKMTKLCALGFWAKFHVLHCKITCCLMLCGSYHMWTTSAENESHFDSLRSVCEVFGVYWVSVIGEVYWKWSEAIAFNSFILLHLGFCFVKLLDLSCLLLCFMQMNNLCCASCKCGFDRYFDRLVHQTVMTFNFNSNGLSCNAICHVKGYYHGLVMPTLKLTLPILFFSNWLLELLHVYLKSTG